MRARKVPGATFIEVSLPMQCFHMCAAIPWLMTISLSLLQITHSPTDADESESANLMSVLHVLIW